MSKRGGAASGKGTKPVEVTPMPDISALSKEQQKKFLTEWLKIQKMRAWTENLDKIFEGVAYTALFAGQYGIYQHGQEDKMLPAAAAASLTALVYMLKDNSSTWATGIVLTPMMAKIAWDLLWNFPSDNGGGFTSFSGGIGGGIPEDVLALIGAGRQRIIGGP